MVISILICPNIFRVPRGILSMRMNTMAERKPIYLKCLYNSRSLEWLTIKRVLQFFTQFSPSFHAVSNNCLVYVEFVGVFFSRKHFFLIIYVCPCTRCFILKEKKVLISVLKNKKQNEAFKVFH